MTPWLVDVPQLRHAPESVRRSLRALDPTAEVLYLGWSRWAIGRVRPTSESVRIATGMLANYWKMSADARRQKRGVQRYRFALACRQGFRPVFEVSGRDLDGRDVETFRLSQWRMQHETTDPIDAMEAEELAASEARRDLLRDELRAKETLDYTRQSNFGYAVSSVAKPTPTPRGRTLIRAI